MLVIALKVLKNILSLDKGHALQRHCIAWHRVRSILSCVHLYMQTFGVYRGALCREKLISFSPSPPLALFVCQKMVYKVLFSYSLACLHARSRPVKQTVLSTSFISIHRQAAVSGRICISRVEDLIKRHHEITQPSAIQLQSRHHHAQISQLRFAILLRLQ